MNNKTKNGYRVEHKSKANQTYEIYKVEHGFDTECFMVDYSGKIEEHYILDHEHGLDIKTDPNICFALIMPILIGELRHAIKEFEADREELEPWSYRKLLMEPYRRVR